MANLNLNKVILAGKLTFDPELKQAQSGTAVLSLQIAVNRRSRRSADGQQSTQEADFINAVAFGQTAEFISRFFHKGSSICIVGSIRTNTWQDQNGQKRNSVNVYVDEAMFVDSKGEAGGSGYTPDAYGVPSFSTGANDMPKFEDVNTDDGSLPF